MDELKLLSLAEEGKEKAYAPYSGFQVGAALLTKEGRVFIGCNVENASYGLSNCAERTAVFSAVAAGCRDFDTLAIVSDSETFTYPCGACRQVLVEFNPDLKIIMRNQAGELKVEKAWDLLPHYFSGQNMEKLEGGKS
ncbi:cytidine deaminase [Dehalobacterium formicoaceticum]|uniref:Cytidine deaminase n=1 Tax=Dehalobacterium formicoaceticum TaxID=51515 RepID=A0ABT1XZI5_9FIRM|nr:cytidine deaminase [Dehalobacterium formicoaceticum]MCR6544032.1 cytidine deaminase [Dehalobacterium formicoaceticum]